MPYKVNALLGHSVSYKSRTKRSMHEIELSMHENLPKGFHGLDFYA